MNFTMISFDNYILRLISEKDVFPFYALVSNNKNRISNYFPKTTRANSSIDNTVLYIGQKINQAEAKESFCFVIEDTENKRLAGAVFLKNFDWSVPKCELGYFADKEYEGKGIISHALKEIIHYSFHVLKLNKLFLRTAIDNIKSKKLAENNGFHEEGILRKDFMTEKGELINVVYYGLLKDENH